MLKLWSLHGHLLLQALGLTPSSSFLSQLLISASFFMARPGSSSPHPYLQAFVLFCSHHTLHHYTLSFDFSQSGLHIHFQSLYACNSLLLSLNDTLCLSLNISIKSSPFRSFPTEFSSNNVALLDNWMFVRVSYLSKWDPWGREWFYRSCLKHPACSVNIGQNSTALVSLLKDTGMTN